MRTDEDLDQLTSRTWRRCRPRQSTGPRRHRDLGARAEPRPRPRRREQDNRASSSSSSATSRCSTAATPRSARSSSTSPPTRSPAFIGPSGCGKTTVLRCLNRMHDITPGAQGARIGDVPRREISTGRRSTPPRCAAASAWCSRSRTRSRRRSSTTSPTGRRSTAGSAASSSDIVEHALTRAALWDEVKDKLKNSGLSLSGGQQQRLVHRACARGRARRRADGRAVLGARPDRHRAHRRPHGGAQARLHDRDRHPQHAAGGACLRSHRVLHGRGRRRRVDGSGGSSSSTSPRSSSPLRAIPAPRATSPGGSAELATGATQTARSERSSRRCRAASRRAAETERDRLAAALDESAATASSSSTPTAPRCSATPRPSATAKLGTPTRSPPVRIDRAARRRARAANASERELQLFGPPRAVAAAPGGPARRRRRGRSARRSFVYDVSEIHRVESVRRDFVANVSHELKTPIGALEVLAETLARRDRPRGDAAARRAAREGGRSARPDRRRPPRPQPDRDAGVADAASRCRLERPAGRRGRPRAAGGRGRGHRPARSTIPRPARWCACDRRQLVSAIANLLDNAVKYSEPGSRGRRRATAGRATGVVITVRDHGIGIPSRDLERIFERFYRVDQARSRDDRRHRARARDRAPRRAGARRRGHRRVAWKGEGSTFRLVAAARTRSTPIRSERARRRLMADPPLILVVDDEQSYRDALRVALEREGFRVEIAADGPEALERFDAARPALVLLDVMLPRISGVDVCRELRTRSQVPIIMVTARNAEIDAVVGLEVGADDYVTKPFRLRELVARVRAALRRGRPERRTGRRARRGHRGRRRAPRRRPPRGAGARRAGRAAARRSSSCSSSCSRTRAACSPATC